MAHTALLQLSQADTIPVSSLLRVLWGHAPLCGVAFIVTLLLTPVIRHLAHAYGVVDRPNDPRKIHKKPTAYLGGVAVCGGILSAVLVSLLQPLLFDTTGIRLFSPQAATDFQRVFPPSILLGLTLISLIGLVDDVTGINPRLKIAGQLVVAAAMAMDDVGVRVAAGFLRPLSQAIGHEDLRFTLFTLPWFGTPLVIDVIYWAGTGIIAAFVLGGTNASNLIDGLDGLLSGVICTLAIGVLVVGAALAQQGDGPLDASRMVLAMGVLGACLGFLVFNFHPASIFLGDCGSMLLGFCAVTMILTLGDTGTSSLVIAGMLFYAVPMLDTALTIIRRKLAGVSMTQADAQHMHHMLKRSLGVRGAACTLWVLNALFVGCGLLVVMGGLDVLGYGLAIVLAAVVGTASLRAAKRARLAAIRQIQEKVPLETASTAPEASGPSAPPIRERADPLRRRSMNAPIRERADPLRRRSVNVPMRERADPPTRRSVNAPIRERADPPTRRSVNAPIRERADP